MKVFVYFVCLVSLCAVCTEAVECENGWKVYKDEQCIKVFPDFLTYEEAKYFCASQGNGVARSTMVMIKDFDIQAFLGTVIEGVYEHMWIGGKFEEASGLFIWEDGDPIAFTNWADGFPRNISDPDVCIQVRPENAKVVDDLKGKWEDAVCQRRNRAICQREATWGLNDAVREIINLRKRLETTSNTLQETQQNLDATTQNLADTKYALDITNQKLTETTGNLEAVQSELELTKENLETVNSKVVPIGSIYIEYFNQPSPTVLWPTLGWEDVTSSYAGLFFRALGGDSESWGTNQEGCSPRLQQAIFTFHDTDTGLTSIHFSESGMSPQLYVGAYHGGQSPYVFERLQFKAEVCEVRPKIKPSGFGNVRLKKEQSNLIFQS